MTTLSLHPEHASLLTDICANRRDLTPRLIYADWIEDHAHLLDGREKDWRARAEFIRLGCKLIEYDIPFLPTDRRWAATHNDHRSDAHWRAEFLLRRHNHRHAWLDDEFRRAGVRGDFYAGDTYADDRMEVRIPIHHPGSSKTIEKRFPLTWKWHAGFPDHLSCSWSLWDKISDRLHAAWPVTGVEVTHAGAVLTWHLSQGNYRDARLLLTRPPGARVASFRLHEGEYRASPHDQDERAVRELCALHWPGVCFAFPRTV